MESKVTKTGCVCFDALHTFGLGILLATATGRPVILQDEGMCYRLSSSLGKSAPALPDLLETIWQIPTIEDLSLLQTGYRDVPLTSANLDGLLAALFTQTGPRLVSMADLLLKARRSRSPLPQGLQKVQRATAQWKSWAERAGGGSSPWLDDLLQEYSPATASLPSFSISKKHQDLSIWLTLEPSLGFSTRRPWSDGIIDDQTNLTLSSPRYGVLLARIGAARFLRAQPVAEQLINYYLPLASTLTLQAETALPLLPPLTLPSDQALSAQWLGYVHSAPPLEATWGALAYQVLQVQGAHAPISRESGVLPLDWIMSMTEHVGYGLMHFWRSALGRRQEDTAYPVDALCSTLLTRHPDAWMAHLREHTWAAQMSSQEKVRPYTFQECKELMNIMTLSTPSPLRSILEREQGTLRFGRALRLLGHVNHASLVETLDLLEGASTLEEMLLILGHAVQDCALASAKSPFVVIPNEKDLKYVGDDVAQYGVRLVANLLLILSALRYPPVTAQGAETAIPPPGEAGEEASETAGEAEPHMAEEGGPNDT